MKIHSLAISGLMTLNLHSLNNEGAEGNYVQTRLVQVVDSEGKTHSVNAISGDMFKHIQAEHLFMLATDENLPLCNACRKFDANRIVGDAEFAAGVTKETSDTDVLTAALKRCIVDDLEGILITSKIGEKNRAISRKSTLEFGWVVGKPDNTQTDSYFHVKFAPEGRGKGSGDETGAANTGQNIFHRPTSSGQYAIVLNLDLFRIGQNDISREYVLDIDERKKRIQALLKSILFTFIKPNGAMRNTQNPHIVNFEGCISFSKNTLPSPLESPLNQNYRDEIEKIQLTLNKVKPNSIEVKPFNSLAQFADEIAGLIECIEPYGR